MQELRQSTQVDVRIGPAMDYSDGVTAVTTLALATADEAELLKHNGAATVDISGATMAAVSDCDGWYDLTLTTSHTDTLGQLTVVIQDADLIVPIFRDFMVISQQVWDSKYSTDRLQVDVRELGDDTLGLTTQMKADVDAEVDEALAGDASITDWDDGGRLDLLLDAVKAKTDNLPSGVPKNVALNNFVFVMVDSSDHVSPKASLTVTAQVSKDGGALASCSNSVSEISNGAYKINFTQTEMNADIIFLRFSASGADDRLIVIKTDS